MPYSRLGGTDEDNRMDNGVVTNDMIVRCERRT
jgi:hypothetical protein